MDAGAAWPASELGEEGGPVGDVTVREEPDFVRLVLAEQAEGGDGVAGGVWGLVVDEVGNGAVCWRRWRGTSPDGRRGASPVKAATLNNWSAGT